MNNDEPTAGNPTAHAPADAPVLNDPGSRVLLRGHRIDDIPAIIEQCRDPEMVEYTRIPRPYTIDHAHQLLDLARTGWAQPSTISPRYWAITAPTAAGYAFAGTIDYRPTGHGTATIGYGLHPAHRGAGLMSIALALVLDYAFERDGQELMTWQAMVGNWASAKTAWRCGFQLEGRVRGLCLLADGGIADGWIATLHRDDPRLPTGPWSRSVQGQSAPSRTFSSP